MYRDSEWVWNLCTRFNQKQKDKILKAAKKYNLTKADVVRMMVEDYV